MKRKIFFTFLLFQFFTHISFSQYNNWVDYYYGMSGDNIQTFTVSGEYIYAGSYLGGMFYSSNNGERWISINNPIPNNRWFDISSIISFGNNVMVCNNGSTNYEVFLSTNNGKNWELRNNGINSNPKKLAFNSSGIFLGCGTGMYFTSNMGLNWVLIIDGLPFVPPNYYPNIYSLETKGNDVYTGVTHYSLPNGIYKTTNNGQNWYAINSGLPPSVSNNAIFFGNNYILTTAGGSIYKTTNDGISWFLSSTGLPGINLTSITSVNSFVFCGTYFLSEPLGSVFRSSNNGSSWISVRNGLPTNNIMIGALTNKNNILFSSIGTKVNASSIWTIYKSSDNGSNWIKSGKGISECKITSFVLCNNSLFAGTYGNGIYRDVNYYHWVLSNDSLSDFNVNTLSNQNEIIFAGTDSLGIFRSSDSCKTWIECNSGLINKKVKSIISYNSNLYAGTKGGGIYKSTNSGNSWSNVNTGLSNLNVNCLKSKTGYVYAGTDSGFYVSSNEGTSWYNANNGISNKYIKTIGVAGQFLYTISLDGFYRSTNNGQNWYISNSGLPSPNINAIETKDSSIFLGLDTNGVYVSTNTGLNWKSRNAESSWGIDTHVVSFGIKNDLLYYGTKGLKVYRTSLPNLISGINGNAQVIPDKWALFQNYPNPFNPVTSIEYQINKSGFVSLKVYDILGKEVKTLVNEKKSPGLYKIEWDAANYPSGVYFYRLSVNEFIETKKMILLK